ncbi:non-specific serine/threonine protein kinase [Anaeramoeba flamelloides]|uniref:non-specific serine/threonine protein kinase n=1 Tax=Anaeramoeba flamelloides TaxID=1746091 RepID=A0AAV7YWH3_9EUKA|nr:non-specific serine/threonine protein kinase [Anaeramoeba flamelloides]KAJ6246635.1 non-specific serine/threonine protein kinase [Anaeramoeba flamelloides]
MTEQSNGFISKVGNYLLGKKLGEGKTGKVHLAVDERDGQTVAVKIINKKKLKDLKLDQKIKREVKVQKIFCHPHIVRLFDVIEAEEDIYLIMEYINGGELFDYIVEREALSEPEARRFFQQMISGLSYIHSKGVVHRDIKPENLLLDSNCNCKIADFGLSNMMEDGELLSTSCGTPNYASPEVIGGKQYAGPEIDAWSCGVVLYAMLLGALPFDEENVSVLFKKIKEAKYYIPYEEVSSEALDLITRLLDPNPLERLTIEEIYEHPWFKVEVPNYITLWHTSNTEELKFISEPISEVFTQLVKYLKYDDEKKLMDSLKFGENQSYVEVYRLMAENYKLENKKFQPENFKIPVHKVRDDSQVFDPQVVKKQKITKKKLKKRKSNIKPPSHWALGVLTREPPHKIMTELYRTLVLANFQWKVISPYKIRCKKLNKKQIHSLKLIKTFKQNSLKNITLKQKKLKKHKFTNIFHHDHKKKHNKKVKKKENKTENQEKENEVIEKTKEYVSFENEISQIETEITIFLASTKRGESKYMLDFRKISGNGFPFFYFCSVILEHLNLEIFHLRSRNNIWEKFLSSENLKKRRSRKKRK